MQWIKSLPYTVLFSSIAASFSVYAVDTGIVGQKLDQKSVQEYWTPERLQHARELPIPQVDKNALNQTAEPLLSNEKGESGDGALPEKRKFRIKPQNLFAPNVGDDGGVVGGDPTPPGQGGEKPVPNDSGTYNQPYSSSRLVPITADTSYPYVAVGKLFFTIQGKGDYVCSASVLRPRVVLTAGHCTHKGSGGSEGFYTNFYFVPAYRDGTAPVQGWYPNYVATTNTWATGNGTVPNAADYAMFQMQDNTFSGTLYKIGSITGYLGYQTLALAFNHATLLGYPCNLDGCQKMHQVNSRNGNGVSPNNVEYGSDMRGGSSGGPWVQNFGAYAVGQVEAKQPGINRVIGVTSYGYDSTDPKVQGSSIPDSRFTNLLNMICTHQTGNC